MKLCKSCLSHLPLMVKKGAAQESKAPKHPLPMGFHLVCIIKIFFVCSFGKSYNMFSTLQYFLHGFSKLITHSHFLQKSVKIWCKLRFTDFAAKPSTPNERSVRRKVLQSPDKVSHKETTTQNPKNVATGKSEKCSYPQTPHVAYTQLASFLYPAGWVHQKYLIFSLLLQLLKRCPSKPQGRRVPSRRRHRRTQVRRQRPLSSL